MQCMRTRASNLSGSILIANMVTWLFASCDHTHYTLRNIYVVTFWRLAKSVVWWSILLVIGTVRGRLCGQRNGECVSLWQSLVGAYWPFMSPNPSRLSTMPCPWNSSSRAIFTVLNKSRIIKRWLALTTTNQHRQKLASYPVSWGPPRSLGTRLRQNPAVPVFFFFFHPETIVKLVWTASYSKKGCRVGVIWARETRLGVLVQCLHALSCLQTAIPYIYM